MLFVLQMNVFRNLLELYNVYNIILCVPTKGSIVNFATDETTLIRQSRQVRLAVSYDIV